MVNKMNIYVFFTTLICLTCSVLGEERDSLQEKLTNILINYQLSKTKNSESKELEELKLVNSNIDQYKGVVNSGTAKLANLLLENELSQERWGKKDAINLLISSSLIILYASSFINGYMHDLEKSSPLLPLTSAFIVTTVLSNSNIVPKIRNFVVISVILSAWCFVLTYFIKPQNFEKPWDLMSISFPLTAGLTKRILIDPAINSISRGYKPFKGGENV